MAEIDLFEAFAASDRGRKREKNEDAYVCDPERGLFLVADGMGGENYGEVASRMTAEQFFERILPFIVDEDATLPFEQEPDGHAFGAVVMHAVEMTNKAVVEFTETHPSHRGMGSTLTAAVYHNGRFQIAHIGDSRLYRLDEEGIIQTTTDHTKVNELIHHGILTTEEARNHPQKHILTRCIGRSARFQPDVFELEARAGESLLICSDGLHDMLEDEVIHRVVLQSDDVQDAVENLIEEANAKGGRDNITVVLFRMGEA